MTNWHAGQDPAARGFCRPAQAEKHGLNERGHLLLQAYGRGDAPALYAPAP
jgi:hypothetical protein